MIAFDRDICTNFGVATQKEWIETNGLGGYASSTITGINTRGYHGLLIAATKPPLQRMLLLSKIEETFIIGNKRYEISSNQYPNAIYPEGYKYLDSFQLDPFPTFRYIIDDTIIEKTIFMLHGENVTFINYRLLESNQNVIAELRPLVACRDFHGRMHEWLNPEINLSFDNEVMSMEMNGLKLNIMLQNGKFIYQPYWYRDFEYEIEEQRGQESHEDLYSPGYFNDEIEHGIEISLIVTTDDPHKFDMEKSRSYEISRRFVFTKNGILAKIPEQFQQCVSSLLAASDQFIVRRGDYHSIIAGYHWFGDWGRDSMISLTGLVLVPERYEIAEEILLNYAKYCDQGMIPNCYPEFDEKPQYNSVDASLWFIYAAKKYLDYTDNILFVENKLYDTISDIVRNYREGTRYNIHTDTDGLLYAGQNGTQLTWMDAKIGDIAFTPRIGKPVEINALWFNALKFMEELSIKLEHKGNSQMYSELSEKTKQSFNERFWNENESCLYDCIDGDQIDDSIRPNQIFAISLPYPVLENDKMLSVLDIVKRELLTPYGLRSLSPKDEKYIGFYQGDQFSRDRAYHQGTVWAWLLGAFIDAYIRVHGHNKDSVGFIHSLICGFSKKHIYDAGLGSISEIFDGNSSHYPRGCIAQAWSIAEILRAIVENDL
jgi:predicted glycogen debranching enzyme